MLKGYNPQDHYRSGPHSHISLRCFLGLHQLRTLTGRPCTREGHTHG